ncbi:MAG: U32 family peptidase, partial [Oscillospiraceae bacterium]|nr:U32 family peptidase [Oscillospiraceae bacterium]
MSIEILSPAGDMERFEAALDYGADAIYLGRETFGMRAGPKNFTYDELKAAVTAAHAKGRKVYLTCNTLPRNDEIAGFEEYVAQSVDCGIDAMIIADIGVMSLVKKYAPDMEIHMSTQTGIVNYVTARELYSMGAKRVVLARELSLEEIAEIRAKTPSDMEIEVFVHGAMCVSFSGRCLLSEYLTARDPNRGRCAQPCRWSYTLMEEKRQGQYFPVFEDDLGTYILNSRDMCMLSHIDDVVKAGACSLKIEGRAKSAYYVGLTTNAYRMAADILEKDPEHFSLPKELADEVFKISHRAYCTGFFYGRPEDGQYYEDSGYIRDFDAAAVVEECRDGRLWCIQRNKFAEGSELEIISPGKMYKTLTANDLRDENGEKIESVCHAAMRFSMSCPEGMSFPKN